MTSVGKNVFLVFVLKVCKTEGRRKGVESCGPSDNACGMQGSTLHHELVEVFLCLIRFLGPVVSGTHCSTTPGLCHTRLSGQLPSLYCQKEVSLFS